mmetsp:Transcript_7244/g.16418  ORF Transcript_7244/g.16418 Transcript_7244/m.16418 type:complete len:211 (-) Transcript_7244:234-866(-)
MRTFDHPIHHLSSRARQFKVSLNAKFHGFSDPVKNRSERSRHLAVAGLQDTFTSLDWTHWDFHEVLVPLGARFIRVRPDGLPPHYDRAVHLILQAFSNEVHSTSFGRTGHLQTLHFIQFIVQVFRCAATERFLHTDLAVATTPCDSLCQILFTLEISVFFHELLDAFHLWQEFLGQNGFPTSNFGEINALGLHEDLGLFLVVLPGRVSAW